MTASRVWAIKPAPVGIWLEGIGDADHGFSRAQRQYAIGFEYLCDALEDMGLGVLVEIDQHVAAEDHVEGAEVGEVLQQVELLVLHHGADVGIELPQLALL